MDKNKLNILIIFIFASLVLFAGCVEEETTISTETPTITASPTVTASPTFTIEPDIPSPTPTPNFIIEYLVTYKLHDLEIEYFSGRKQEIIGSVASGKIMKNYTLEVVDTDFRVTHYERVKSERTIKIYEVTHIITKELYDEYNKMLNESIYDPSILYYPRSNVMTLSERKKILVSTNEFVQKIIDFLKKDLTDENELTRYYKRSSFSIDLAKNASHYNLSIGSALICDTQVITEYDSYTLNYFYADEQLYFIDPLRDDVIMACDFYSQDYRYAALWPDGTQMPLNLVRKRPSDVDLSEICD